MEKRNAYEKSEMKFPFRHDRSGSFRLNNIQVFIRNRPNYVNPLYVRVLLSFSISLRSLLPKAKIYF